ncbi:hypothetical protein AAIB41_10920 [Brucella sp. BE17]|uniref:hypothetical protein n=1 Tax=Brucella sp. BE17 TaxID=3142977 RepID=UPI0031BB5800
MEQENKSLRKKRSSIVEPALRGAVLATPLVAALLAIYVAYGSDNRISVAIDKTITSAITTNN